MEEPRQFLKSARRDRDPMYTAYVLILVLGLRRGEVLGLTWPMVNVDEAEIEVSYGLQRIGGRLVNGETKTPASDAILPLPDICATAFRLQKLAHDKAKAQVDQLCADSGYVITAVDGQPMDPRNFFRTFQKRCLKAGVRQIPVHGTDTRAVRFWPPSTSIPGWPCRSCATARSPSRLRSTRTYLPRSRAAPCAGWVSSSTAATRRQVRSVSSNARRQPGRMVRR